MARRRQLYEGKAKVLFEGPEPGTLVQYFKDDATSGNGAKKGTITGKGVLNNRISEYLMTRLGEIGVPTHFVRRLNMREQLDARGGDHPDRGGDPQHRSRQRWSTRSRPHRGHPFCRAAIVEYYYKNDALGDPLVSEEHVTAFGWANDRRTSTKSWRWRSG